MKNIVPSWTLRTLYHAYVQSVLEYGIVIWGTMCDKLDLKTIFTKQKKAIRIIDGASYNAHTLPIFHKYNILKLEDIIKLHLVKLAFLYAKNDLPEQVMNLFNSNAMLHDYDTRSKNQANVAKHKTALFNKSFLTKAPSLFRILPQSIKNACSIRSFTKQYQKAQINTYKL